ncbi:MAG: response regulator transcription factor [Chitinophagaceae bacterium]
MKKISVLIADDHKLLRDTLSIIIGTDPAFEVVATCADGAEAIEFAGLEKPDIILMDINMTPVSGIEATSRLTKLTPGSKVIGMSAHSEPVYVKKMLKMGARGYITKNSSKDEFIQAMKSVQNGEVYICQEIKDILGERLGSGTGSACGMELLTEREIQIVEFIRQGQSSKEIATTVGVAVKTVEVHRHHILKKLQLKNSAALINFLFKESHFAF